MGPSLSDKVQENWNKYDDWNFVINGGSNYETESHTWKIKHDG